MSEKYNAKYAFYYLLSLAALVFMSISVGLIAFGIINETIVDTLALNNYINFNSQYRFAISAILIAAPIFYVVNGLISRGLQKGELDPESGIRRWLTYFILFVSSLIILGVFIGTINDFLSGELTLNFILKSLTMFIISGTVFSYYLYDVKRTDPTKKDKVVKIFFFASLALVLAAFISSWFFVESPKESRNRRLDEIVINNIYNLESAVNSYYDTKKALPNTMEEIKTQANFFLNDTVFVDPETQEPLVYNKIDDKTFEFCTTFRTSTFGKNDVTKRPTSYAIGSKDHDAGYQCLKSTLWNYPKRTLEKENIIMAEPVIE